MQLPLLRLSALAFLFLGLLSLDRAHAQEAAAAAQPPAASEVTFTAEQIAFFEQQVQPILKARCLECHGGTAKIRGGLRLTSRAAILRGGDLGPAAKPGDPAASALISAVEYRDLEMPPSGRLPAAEVELLRRWVKEGLPWTPGASAEEPPPEPARSRGGVVDDEARQYWAYQPLRRPEVPAVRLAEWPVNAVDAFVLAPLEAASLQPNPPADPVALVRRAYYDLLGLPPTPEQVAAFVQDPSPAAYERLLDTLLESPHYGEKWGRHWLDLVRYAETNGFERDNPKPEAWRYRDYVIDAFNSDKPYDQFVREQLAGDELDQVTRETLTATGYYRLGIWDDEPADRALAKYDVLDGVVSTTAQVMLGMSMGCARCHEHKRDPIPQRDYYRLLAVFRDITDMNGKNTRRISEGEQRAAYERQVAAKAARETQLYGELYHLRQTLLAAWRKSSGTEAAGWESDLTELRYRFYRDTWDSLPDFPSLKAEDEGTVASRFISLEPASRQEAIGLVFEGQLKVPADGNYTFDVESSEGVRLSIGNQIVIARPGKGRHSARAAVSLTAGLVPLRLEYFNSTSRPRLNVGWTGPDGQRRSLSDDGQRTGGTPLCPDSRETGRNWRYTTQQPAAAWLTPAFDDAAWQQGPGGFGVPGTPGAVVRTGWNTPDIWLRTAFDLAQLPTQLALDIHHDEDAEVYLNGTLIHRGRRFLTTYQRVALGQAALQAARLGRNVLAVHCHQTGGGQYIDVGLVAAPASVDFASLLETVPTTVWDPQQVQRYRELMRQWEASRQEKLAEPGIEVMCVAESGRAETTVLLRGNPNAPGDKVLPGVPSVLTTDPQASLTPISLTGAAAETSSGKRRALAEWIVHPSNPLTARVLANRLWQYHFGRGIVPTPNDFGKLGELPTHPELLDWLAVELRDGGWHLKRMHKLLMMSATYRMSSRGQEAALAKDPADHLWWRYPMRRLTAEEIRDSMLAVSGQLNLQRGGPSVYPPIPQEVLAGQSRPGSGWGKASPEEAARRSVYIHVKRSLLVPLLSDNDAADTDNSCPVRYTTTVPTQALGMLNGEFTNAQAAALAQRVQRERPGDRTAQVIWAVLLISSRIPSDAEVREDLRLLDDLRSQHRLSDEAALTQFCLLLLNTNAFIYLD